MTLKEQLRNVLSDGKGWRLIDILSEISATARSRWRTRYDPKDMLVVLNQMKRDGEVIKLAGCWSLTDTAKSVDVKPVGKYRSIDDEWSV